jgi:hypothetical protein
MNTTTDKFDESISSEMTFMIIISLVTVINAFYSFSLKSSMDKFKDEINAKLVDAPPVYHE